MLVTLTNWTVSYGKKRREKNWRRREKENATGLSPVCAHLLTPLMKSPSVTTAKKGKKKNCEKKKRGGIRYEWGVHCNILCAYKFLFKRKGEGSKGREGGGKG